VPDQSQQFSKTSPPKQQEEGVVNNPASMAGNSPAEATPESRESNVTRASEGEKTQAAQTIEGDPTVGTGSLAAELAAGDTSDGDNYDNEDAWSYRSLQQEARARNLPGDGKRAELVERLRQHDAEHQSEDKTESVPRAEVDPTNVDNGGIQRTAFAQQHSEILQGLSSERRQQQLAAIRERSSQRQQQDQPSDQDGNRDEERVNA
jgi:hypothetical protein